MPPHREVRINPRRIGPQRHHRQLQVPTRIRFPERVRKAVAQRTSREHLKILAEADASRSRFCLDACCCCPCRSATRHGFGRAVACGLEQMRGDAVVVMMADESDDCRDVVRYWLGLNEGWDCVFGSRFIKGGG